jgi:hypothetical protein
VARWHSGRNKWQAKELTAKAGTNHSEGSLLECRTTLLTPQSAAQNPHLTLDHKPSSILSEHSRKTPSDQRVRLLQNDPEQPLAVEAPQIRMERLRFANQGLLIGKALSERAKSPIGVDIIDDGSASGSEGSPSPIQLKAHIAFTVQAVVDEKIDLAQACQQFGKASPA